MQPCVRAVVAALLLPGGLSRCLHGGSTLAVPLQAIGSACNLGGFFAIPAGLFYDRLEAYGRLGPRLTLVVGAAFNAAGYLGLWAAATR